MPVCDECGESYESWDKIFPLGLEVCHPCDMRRYGGREIGVQAIRIDPPRLPDKARPCYRSKKEVYEMPTAEL